MYAASRFCVFAFVVKNGAADPSDPKPDFFQVSVRSAEVEAGELVAVVGRVGSGKTAMLAALLDELDQLNSGSVKLHGRCAVCEALARGPGKNLVGGRSTF